jgi:dihydroxyacetone kinase DhaKLM complex PTS-EIIA-like component DhaM
MGELDKIEMLFKQLLTASGSVLSEAELDEIRHFVDVGEYGLALETAVDIFAEERKVPPLEAVRCISGLAETKLDAAESNSEVVVRGREGVEFDPHLTGRA